MKLFSVSKDGGPKSNVWAFWLAEIKPLFSAALLKFSSKSRDQFHSHAFDSLSWVVGGSLTEEHLDGRVQRHKASFAPIVTAKSTFHRVSADDVTWVVTLRGPWAKHWQEYTHTMCNGVSGRLDTLTHGRKMVDSTFKRLGL